MLNCLLQDSMSLKRNTCTTDPETWEEIGTCGVEFSLPMTICDQKTEKTTNEAWKDQFQGYLYGIFAIDADIKECDCWSITTKTWNYYSQLEVVSVIPMCHDLIDKCYWHNEVKLKICKNAVRS